MNIQLETLSDLEDTKRKAKHPRPLLVKFNKAADVSKVLFKRNRQDKSFIIKPDRSITDRAQEFPFWRNAGHQSSQGTVKAK